MSKGPTPISAALSRRLGTFRQDRAPVSPDSGPLQLEAPSWLGPLALEEWRRVVGELGEQGRLARVDTSMLAAYCTELATYRRLTAWLEEHGHVVVLPNGISALRPEAKQADTALKNAMKIAGEFGMTPSARARSRSEIPPEVPDWRSQLA